MKFILASFIVVSSGFLAMSPVHANPIIPPPIVPRCQAYFHPVLMPDGTYRCVPRYH